MEPLCKKIDKYIFNFSDILGKGNFSKVYMARHEITNEQVAIKIVQLNSLKSKKLEELLFAEIDVLKKLNHPNVLRCLEVFTSNRNCYIITQLCNSGDLQSNLRSKIRYSEAQAQPIIRDVFAGLLYLAQKNIVHRDLKVANIFMHDSRAKIADFGFAKFTNNNFQDINIGSPIYMSPEGLINNIYGSKTDIWSFGILIYQMLHGETPFSHCKSEKELKYAVSTPISWNSIRTDISIEIKEAISACMEINQNKRHSAFELAQMPYFRRIMGESMHTPISTQLFTSLQFPKSSSRIDKDFLSPGHNDDFQPINSDNWKIAKPMQSIPIGQSINMNSRNLYLQVNDNKSRERSFTPAQNNKVVNTSTNLRQNKLNTNSSQHDQTKGLSVDRQDKNIVEHKWNMNQHQKQSNMNINVGGNRLINSILSFKSCVNFLHYCRLVYKHILLLKGQPEDDLQSKNQLNVFLRWLSIMLTTLNMKIQNKQVYFGGESSQIKEKKLKEVSTEYTKKYSSELGIDITKINLEENTTATFEYMSNYFFTLYQKMDSTLMIQRNESLLMMGHSLLMIYYSTLFLKKCYDRKNYEELQKYTDIQSFLSMKKAAVDYPSYLWFKKKYSI